MPVIPILRRLRQGSLGAILLAALAGPLAADPLSRKVDIDFFRDISSRNLRGLATRADGRLVAGPVFTDLSGTAPAELLWCLEPGANGQWLLGTGPEGEIFTVTLDSSRSGFSARQLVRLDDPQVFTLRRLADGSILAGTSPRGGLDLVRAGALVARTGLPVDSIFDILPRDQNSVLVATGNPGRIYRVALAPFAAAGIGPDKVTDASALAARGVTLFGEIRDRNVRRLARLGDGRIAAGSAPDGNVYAFPAAGGAPLILQENHDAEVTDLLPESDGSLDATIVFGGEGDVEGHAVAADKGHSVDSNAIPPPAQVEKFAGHSWLVNFPADGFPEILTARSEAAFYRLAHQGRLILIAGGDEGDFTGYDPDSKLALTFAGSASARLSGLAPIPGSPGRFLALRNNAPGLAVIDFNSGGVRQAETDAIDLETPARVGALRFNRLRDLTDRQLDLAIKASNGSDEWEGWSPWIELRADDGWRADSLRGRYVKLRLRWAADTAPTAELDQAELYFLPQNHRPVLQDFRLLPPNFALVPAPEEPLSSSATLGQWLMGRDDDRHKNGILASPVVPAPGMQIAYWDVTAPSGDNVACTFSIRRDGDPAWTDLAVGDRDSYVQFDTSHLADGIYFTRLIASEIAPRPPAERLAVTFETDDLVIDHTPPAIVEASARREGDVIVVTVHGRDALTLLDRVEVDFNNGAHETVDQPVDGIRDGRDKTFVLEEPVARAAGATSVEVTLYDEAQNASSRRLSW